MRSRIAESVAGHPIAAVVAAVLALFAVLTAGFGRGGVSGASVREWDRIIPDREPGYRGGQIGVSRPIRSDEWATSIPFVLAQCRSPEFFPRVNARVNGGTDMFVETPCAPVWDWTAVGQFHNWGYFLFGADHGLAWSWWTRYLLLPLFLFLFLLRWCYGDALVAAAGAAAVTLGAPTQWWDTTIPYHLVYLFASAVFLRQVLSARAWWTSALSATALAVSLASFMFVMYMPFTVLLAPVLLALAVFEFAGCGKPAWWRVALVVLALAVVCAEALYFFDVHGEALGAVKGSSYPGARFIRGGSFRFMCERTLADLMSFPSAFTHGHGNLNKCVISEYIGLGVPLAAGIAFAAASRRRPDGMVLLLSGYAAALFAWCVCEWPEWIARATGLFLIPPRRASVIGGFVVLLASLRWVSSRDWERGRTLPAWAAYAVAAVFLGSRAVAFCWHDEVAGWFRSTPGGLPVLACAFALCSLAAFGLLARRRVLFASALIAFSAVTGCAVHPLAEGLSPVYDKTLSRTMLEIDGKAPGVWIANDRVVAQLPVALGLRAYSGTQQYSDAGYWSVVDPEGRRRSVWNRYGHRHITDLEGRGVLENRKRLDAMFYSLDEGRTRRLGVRYVVWRGRPLNLGWLRHVASVRDDHIYEVISAAEETGHED